MKLIRTGCHGIVEAPDNRAVVYDVLDRPFSYFVSGAEYSEAYVRKVWDGRKRLVERWRDDRLGFPAGLYDEAARLLSAAGLEFDQEDRREKRPWAAREPAWEGFPLRRHQEEAVRAATGRPEASGVLNEPVRSGKTLMAARIAFETGQRTVFVAPSDFLVGQARDVFRAALGGVRVSVVGLGEDDASGDVVIASVATLCARQKTRWWEKFRRSFGLAFFDELHHLLGAGEEWRDTALAIDAAHKIGLTGTLDAEEPQIRLWAHALCGPVLHRTSMKYLTDEGYLTPLSVRFVRVDAPSMPDRDWSRSTYPDGIVKCEPRNIRLCREAVAYARDGLPSLVDVSQVGHGRRMTQILRGMLRPGQVQILTGSSSIDERLGVLSDLRSGRVRVVVSTFLGEGIDIPELAVVINGEGGRASPSTIQRLRNLTPHPSKPRAVLVEPIDDHHPVLAAWTAERLKLYRSERCFDIEVEPPTASTPDRSRPPAGRVRPPPS